jgi:hypothetical protein
MTLILSNKTLNTLKISRKISHSWDINPGKLLMPAIILINYMNSLFNLSSKEMLLFVGSQLIL